MPDFIVELSSRAQALSSEDRAHLATELLASLDKQDADVDTAWDPELRRRIQEVEAGTVMLISADQAKVRVRKALERRR